MRRVRGAYKSRAGQPEIGIRPVLALACEGKTEATYSRYLGRTGFLRVKPIVLAGSHGEQLVEGALDHAERLRDDSPDALVTPAAMYDLEGVSQRQIEAARLTAEYAKSKGIKVWINIPVIERWFILHRMHFSIHRTGRSAKRELERTLENYRQSRYKKPGSPQFYTQLLPHTDNAVINCRRSHPEYISSGQLPCLCDFVDFVRNTNL